MALIGYARVSTAEQDTALQTDALRKAGCERIFEDTVSGSTSERPGLSSALAFLREGDVLGVVLNVSYGCGDADAVIELDDALLLKKKERTCLIGSVVGNGNGDALAARRAGGEAEDAAQRENRCENDRYCLFHVDYLLCILIYKVLG